MTLIERLRRYEQLGITTSAIYFDTSTTAENVAVLVAGCLAGECLVARLLSDHIDAREGARIESALLGGRNLILIAGGAKRLPGQLLEAWDRFCEHPRHTSITAGPTIHFEPRKMQSVAEPHALGRLIVIAQRGSLVLRPSYEAWATARDVQQMCPESLEILNFGRASAGSLSMKELCFLHHRDPTVTLSARAVSEILTARAPLTWAELQTLLRTQADDDMLHILEAREAAGLASAEQLDLASEAICFLREERGYAEKIGRYGLEPSIYHVLWKYAMTESQGCVFRGQSDSRWPQDCSLLRPDRDGSPLTIGLLERRLEQTRAFLDALEAVEVELTGARLSYDERLAIAQHYGLPTPLLDYTRSLAVAAFFATGAGRPAGLKNGSIGIVYYFDPRNSAISKESRAAPPAIDFAGAIGLRLGQLRVIEPALGGHHDRIAQQRGVFVGGFASSDLQRMTVGAVYFKQHEGACFEDERCGVTRATLLTPDTRLEELAGAARAAPRRPVNSSLAEVPLGGDGLIGSLGVPLAGTLERGQRVLEHAQSMWVSIDPDNAAIVREILNRHFDTAKLAARTAEIAAPDQLYQQAGPGGVRRSLDDVEQTIHEIAALIGVEPTQLARTLAKYRPWYRPHPETPDLASDIAPDLKTDQARMGIALALFVIGLEHLRTVKGETAFWCFQAAETEFELLRLRRNAAE